MPMWCFFEHSVFIILKLVSVECFIFYITSHAVFNHVRGGMCVRDFVANVKMLFHFLCVSFAHRIFGMLSIKIMLFIFLFPVSFTSQPSKSPSPCIPHDSNDSIRMCCQYLVSHCYSLAMNNDISVIPFSYVNVCHYWNLKYTCNSFRLTWNPKVRNVERFSMIVYGTFSNTPFSHT